MQTLLHHCGFVAILGRPNTGKSTLLNRIMGQKLSITSRKPQTTRAHLLGIKSDNDSQMIFIDTPGLQKKTGNLFNRYMNREVFNALSNIDLAVHVIESLKWNADDENVYTHIYKLACPVILAVNKVDRVKNKLDILPFIDEINTRGFYKEIIPVSAKTGKNISLLEEYIKKLLPAGTAHFPDDQVTNRNERYFAAEFVREKLTRSLGDELPYNISVTIDKFQEEQRIIKISATIWVANAGQKKIVIGKNGAILKKAGQLSRKDMENMFGKKVFLETWVKIKDKWINSAQALKQFGYDIR
jgi:GTP-binding protein Era